MSPAWTSGHAVDQGVKTLVHGKSRVALSRQSQAPEALTIVAANRAGSGTQMSGCTRGERARRVTGTGIPTRSCERLAEDEAEQPVRC